MENQLTILLYHGVKRNAKNGLQSHSLKHIPESEFQRQMMYLKDNYKVLSLTEALRLKRKGSLPQRCVVVTFDDGFKNNYAVAFPVLKKYGIPATLFLSTSFINTNRVFWVDKLEYLINETPKDNLPIETLGREYFLNSPLEKNQTLQAMKSRLKANPELVEDTIKELEKISDCPLKYDYDDFKMLSWDEVRAMRESGLCEFGSHAVEHVIMSHLSRQEKEYQISESKRVLEEELGEKIALFSYPEGQEPHFDNETIEILKTNGFIAAPTAIFGANTQETSDFHLYRNMVALKAPFEECLKSREIYLVAEIGLNYDGDFELARRLIRLAKENGADAVKFQFGWRSKPGDINHIDLEHAKLLKDWADEAGVEMFASIITEEGLDLAHSINFSRYKIASRTVIDNPELCRRVIAEGKPTYVSLGMWEKKEFPFGPPDGERLFYIYCRSKYPTTIEDLKDMPQHFEASGFYGYSDHYLGNDICYLAMDRGAQYIEKHFTINKNSTVIRDHILSATPEEFRQLFEKKQGKF